MLRTVTDAEFIASWFLSKARRWNRRIASYTTVSATQLSVKSQPIEIRIRGRAKYILI